MTDRFKDVCRFTKLFFPHRWDLPIELVWSSTLTLDGRIEVRALSQKELDLYEQMYRDELGR